MNFYISQLETNFSSQIPIISPVLITKHCSTFDHVQSSNPADLLSSAFNINQSKSSSSIRTKQPHLHFHSRDFVPTDIDSPLHISGININSFSYAKVLEGKDHKQKNNFQKSSNLSLHSTSNRNEKKNSLLHTV
jgi:hypothetical protein